jgi:YD repeat-containing protein
MTQITDNLSDSTAYAYDKVSRLTLTSYADGGSDVVKQAYDKAGVLTKRIDQRGTATLYMYDSLHRLTKKQDDPSSPTIVETYALDALGRTTLAQLARSGSTQSAVSYYYDPLSRATLETQQVKGGPVQNIASSYDRAGNRLTLSYPGGNSAAYTYDSDNRVGSSGDHTSIVPQARTFGLSPRTDPHRHLELRPCCPRTAPPRLKHCPSPGR